MSQNLNISSIKNHPHRNLETVVSQLPTPAATDYKGRSGQGFIDRHGKRRISDVLTQTGDNTYLNPQFVEEMMGYEIGWTDFKH